MTRFEALKAARENFPSDQAMADALGVSQPTIWRWLNQSKQMPAEYVLRAEQLTGVSCFDLRPDIYPRDRMVDRKAILHCDLATGQNGFVPHDDVKHSDRFLGVDFDRSTRMKGAAR